VTLAAEAARLEALPLPQLGEEILTRVATPGAPLEGGRATTISLRQHLNPESGKLLGVDGDARDLLNDVVLEGLHAIERAGLLVPEFDNHRGHLDTLHWKLTRTGRAALADGSVAQRIAA
jgi:hypothetical protein